MSTVGHAIGELDVVELREDFRRWPAGTRSTVVSDYGEVKQVEISERETPGAMLDLISMPESGLRLITSYSH